MIFLKSTRPRPLSPAPRLHAYALRRSAPGWKPEAVPCRAFHPPFSPSFSRTKLRHLAIISWSQTQSPRNATETSPSYPSCTPLQSSRIWTCLEHLRALLHADGGVLVALALARSRGQRATASAARQEASQAPSVN